MTSRDSLYFENDASYEYYDHGPLAREVIGQRQVQGIDYAYTLNGWVKGVNSSLGSYMTHKSPTFDMGHDGDVHSANATIGRDAYGYVLNYFTGDYRSIARTYFAATGLSYTGLYNGNISGATYAIKNISPGVIGYTYGYDQLNRMISELAFKGIDTTTTLNNWVATDSIKDLREKVSYDENGNISTYLRHGNTDVGHRAAPEHNTEGINYLISTFQASFPGKHLTTKTIRDSVISYWLNEKKLRLEQVQLMTGHRWISCTERYLQVPMEEQREILKKFHPLS